MTYQRRLGGTITEHATLADAMSQPFAKVSFDVEGKRLILWDDGTWYLRTQDGEWENGKFHTWQQIGAMRIR